MAGSALLLDNLVDDLVPLVDDLRGDLNADFGVRQYRTFVVTRSWDGDCIGEGTPTTTPLEITPPPLLQDEKGIEFQMQAYGREEEGTYTLREVSLTYTETELGGGTIPPKTEVYYRVTDALGQEIQNRYFVLADPPYPDRIKDIGWRVSLRRAEGIQEP